MRYGDNNRYVGVTPNKFKQFILTQIHEAKQERSQLQETSDKFTLNFFGQRAQMINISGFLKNSPENPWTLNMIYAWDNYMRGSVLAENGWICELYCDNVFYRGYPTGFSLGKIAGTELIAQFHMQFIVWERKVTMTKFIVGYMAEIQGTVSTPTPFGNLSVPMIGIKTLESTGVK